MYIYYDRIIILTSMHFFDRYYKKGELEWKRNIIVFFIVVKCTMVRMRINRHVEACYLLEH